MRVLALSIALFVLPVAAVTLVGCETTSSAADLSKLDPSQLMQGYTSKLGDLGNMLKGVNSTENAAMALPKTKDMVSSLGAYAEKIKALPPNQFNSLMSQYGSQLDPAMKTVDDQIARLAQNPTYGSALTTALKGLPRL